MIDLIFDVYQQGGINAANSKAQKASEKVSDLGTELQQISLRLDRLTLASQAMWELIREKTRLTDADIRKRVEQIDMRDGIKDGKISAVVLTCPTCGKPISSKRPVCVYCGERNGKHRVFDIT
jgi:hypothetical protein